MVSQAVGWGAATRPLPSGAKILGRLGTSSPQEPFVLSSKSYQLPSLASWLRPKPQRTQGAVRSQAAWAGAWAGSKSVGEQGVGQLTGRWCGVSHTHTHRGVHTPHFLLHLQAVFWTVSSWEHHARLASWVLPPQAKLRSRDRVPTLGRGGNGALPPESCAAQAVRPTSPALLNVARG